MAVDVDLPGLPPSLSAEEFLHWMSADPPGVYLLGSLNRHITVHSQQRRAINLIRALATGGGLDGRSIAIVGAGFAGLTAAAFALEHTTAEVSIFDAATRPLWLQDSCANRWLHPGIYDWPLRGSLEPCTALPVLNWRAGTAGDVARQVRAAWDRIAATKGRLHTHFESRVKAVTRAPDGKLLVEHDGWQPPFDVVILAVGFGMERDGPGRVGYWNDADGLDGIGPGASVLVSGFGDGGLADVLRLCLPDIRHDSLVELVKLVPADQQRRLVQWDQDYGGDGAALDERYEGLCVEPIVRQLRDARPALARVTLAGKGHLYGARSAILNRFLVSQLRQARGAEAFELVRRPVDESTLIEHPEGRSSIRFTNDGVDHDFDHVVLRLGPRAVYGTIAPLVDWGVGQERRKHWYDTPQSLDRTRVPLGEQPAVGASRGGRREDFLVYESSSRRWCLVLHPSGTTIGWTVHARLALEAAAKGVTGLNPEPLVLSSDDAVAAQATFLDAVRALCAADILIADVTNYDSAVLLLLGIRAAVRRGVTIACTEEALSPEFLDDVPFNLRELNLISMRDQKTGLKELTQTLRAGLMQSGVSPRYLDLPVYDYVREDSSDGPNTDAAHVLFLRPFSGYDDGGRKVHVEARTAAGLRLQGEQRIDAVIDQRSPRLAGQRLYEAIRHWHRCVVDLTWWRPNVLFELGVRLAVRARSVTAATGLGTFCLIDPSVEGDRTFEGSRARLRDLLTPFVYDLNTSEAAFASAFARPLPDDVYKTAARHFRTGQDHFTERVDTMLSAADAVTHGHENPLDAVDLTPLYANDNNPDYALEVRHSVFEQLCAAWYYLAHRDELHNVRPIDLLDPRRVVAFRRFHRLGSRLKNALALRYEPRFQRLRQEIEDRERRARASSTMVMAALLDAWMTLRHDAPWNLDETRVPDDGWPDLIADYEDQRAQLIDLQTILERFDNPVGELPLQGVRLDRRRLETALQCFRRRLA